MRKQSWSYPDIHLSPEQQLLLKASLFRDERAIHYWKEYSSRVVITQEIDWGSFRLLPLLYRNLRLLGVDDSWMGILRGIYRQAWVKNQMLLRFSSQVLLTLKKMGIDTLILKGLPISLLYYKDLGARPMIDIDILVPIAQRNTAFNALIHSGWKPLIKPAYPTESLLINDAALNIRHALGFEDEQKNQVDIHWHLLKFTNQEELNHALWEDSIPFEINGVYTRTLNSTDHLLQTCIHGFGYNATPSFRWVADAFMIIECAGSEINWQRFISFVNSNRLTIPALTTLNFLKKSFEAAIPSEVLLNLQSLPVTPLQTKYFFALSDIPTGIFGQLPLWWYEYRYHCEGKNEMGNKIASLSGFLNYLINLHCLKSWQFPGWFISRSLNKLHKTINRL